MSCHPRHHHDEETSWGSTLAGMIIGAAIGTAVALLYAPKPGRDTRKDLTDRLDQMKHQVEETTKQVAEVAKARVADAKADLTRAVEIGRTAAESRASALRKEINLD